MRAVVLDTESKAGCSYFKLGLYPKVPVNDVTKLAHRSHYVHYFCPVSKSIQAQTPSLLQAWLQEHFQRLTNSEHAFNLKTCVI